MKLSALKRLAIVSMLALGATAAHARYPEHPIKLIVPYAPGGSSDIVGRQVAKFLGDALGTAVVVENVGGGGGANGVQRAAQAPADGYTLLLGANSELLINKLLRPELPYEATRDFTPLASIGTGAIVIAGKTSLKASNLKEAIELSRAQGGGLNYGTSGVGTIQHLVGEMLKLRANAPLTHVAYRGAGPLAADLAAGHVELGIATLASVLPLIQTDKIKGYAVSSARRSEFAPDIPTISETPGLPATSIETWYGVFAPAALPADIARTLQEKLTAALSHPELAKLLAQQAISIDSKDPGELKRFLQQETEKYRAIIAEARISVE
ncbi:tripartite tricarboxylate transporter substrate binding protein [Pigmentiphaga soli]|uniref:Tripartite tricarboxylate transporter substrate binding protein n=1 Tax=Pigmentiphaga soli TaxID=1007095 RepID=A0ABP8HQX1_9BURK